MTEPCTPEPFFVAQTAEPGHLKTTDAMREWMRQRLEEAQAQGGTWVRFTVPDDEDLPTALLIEVWLERPEDQGAPRWLQVAE